MQKGKEIKREKRRRERGKKDKEKKKYICIFSL